MAQVARPLLRPTRRHVGRCHGAVSNAPPLLNQHVQAERSALHRRGAAPFVDGQQSAKRCRSYCVVVPALTGEDAGVTRKTAAEDESAKIY